MKAANEFTIKTDNPHVIFEAHYAETTPGSPRTGRWYWHKKVNGEVTESNNVASRASARRACLKIMALENLKEAK